MAAVRTLAVAGYAPVVTTSGEGSLAAASRHTVGEVRVPLADDPGYADRVRAAAAEHDVVTTLPASDAALLALGYTVADVLDKERLAAGAERVGLHSPPAQRAEDVADVAALVRHGDVALPLVVKPLISRHPARRVDSLDEVAALTIEGPVLIQPYLRGVMEAIGGVVDRGEVLAVVAQRYLRTWPVDCGTASAAITEEVDEDRLARVASLLSEHQGVFQAQFLGDVLLDVNPRVYGSLALAAAAGVNLAAIWCDTVAGRRPATRLVGRPGVRYRWLEGDLRHLATRARRGQLAPRELLAAINPHRGSAHSVESLTDPAPMMARLRHGLGRAR